MAGDLHCCIAGCESSQKSTPNLSFHRIPTEDINVRQEWVDIIRESRSESEWFPHEEAVVCDLHFLPNELIEIPGQTVVPSLQLSLTAVSNDDDYDSISQNNSSTNMVITQERMPNLDDCSTESSSIKDAVQDISSSATIIPSEPEPVVEYISYTNENQQQQQLDSSTNLGIVDEQQTESHFTEPILQVDQVEKLLIPDEVEDLNNFQAFQETEVLLTFNSSDDDNNTDVEMVPETQQLLSTINDDDVEEVEEQTQLLIIEDHENSDLKSVSSLPTSSEIPQLESHDGMNKEDVIKELPTIAVEDEIKQELEEEREEDEDPYQDIRDADSPRSRSISPCFHLSPPRLPPQPLYSAPSPPPPPPPILITKTKENGIMAEKLSLIQNEIKTEVDDQEKEEEEDEDDEMDIDSQIVFCRCCGCFGLFPEFYEGVYCTKACSDSYILLTSKGQDGKFKKPITPVLNKKPKLSCIENEQSYTNNYKNNNHTTSSSSNSSNSLDDKSKNNNRLNNNSNNMIESSLNNHHNVENNNSAFNHSNNTSSNNNNHFSNSNRFKAPVVRKLINKNKGRANNGAVKKNGNNKKLISATKASGMKNEQQSKFSIVNNSASGKIPSVQSMISKSTVKAVVISPNKGKNHANNLKFTENPLKGGLTGSKTTESSPTRAASVRGIQRTKSVELPPTTTFTYSRDRKRSFPQIFSKRISNKTSPERKFLVDSPSTSSSAGNDINSISSSFVSTTAVSSSSSGNRNSNAGDFDWSKYLQDTKTKSAPHRLFRQPALPGKNPFRCGMMLEAVDPQHQSLICVAQVVGIQGFRLRLRFQGFSEAYDFWVNADSLDIFPPCWCEQSGLHLSPPPGMETFNWHQYMVENEIDVAPRDIFAVTKDDFSIESSGVKIGWKLEAVDIRNQNLVCVATVANVMGDRILVHFDSWDSLYDYWTDLTSPFIHPVGWCDTNDVKLTPPNDYKDFTWEKYLRDEKAQAMPTRLFRPLPPVGFKKGFKIECVDKRNPSLIRVATIAEIDEHQLQIHFDDWPSIYDYKVYELSPDIHPVGWCTHTGHPLQPPPSLSTGGSWTGPCPVFGCLGMGHMRGPKFLTHNSEKNCPYALNNYKKDWILADRLVLLERNMSQGHNGDMSISSIDSSQKLESDHSVEIKNNSPIKTSGVKRKRRCFSSRRKKIKISHNQAEITDTQSSEVKTSNNNNSNNVLSNIDVKKFVVKKEIIKNPKQTDETASNITQKVQPLIINQMTIKNIKVEEEGGSEGEAQVIKPKQSMRPSRKKIVRSTKRTIRKPRGGKFQDSSSTNLSIQNEDELKSEQDPDATYFQSKKVPKPTKKYSVPKRLSLDNVATKVSNVNSHDLLGRAISISNLSSSSHQSEDEDRPKAKRRRVSLPLNPSSSTSSTSNKNDHNTTASLSVGTTSENEPEFPHNYPVHSSSLKTIVGSIDEKTVSQWRVHNLSEFIARIPGCQYVSKIFTEHLIDGESFLMLSQNDFIKVMGLKLGPAIKLYNVLRIISFNSN